MDDAPVDLDALEKLLAEAPQWNATVFSRAFGSRGALILGAFPALLREVRRLREENGASDGACEEMLRRVNDLHGAIFAVPNGISFHTHDRAVAAADALHAQIATLRAGLKEACEIARTALVCKLDDSGDTDAYHADVARLRALAEGRG